MEPQWLAYAKRLQAIAVTGLHFTRDQFDRERYEEITSIANEMLAALATVPIERIEGLVSESAIGSSSGIGLAIGIYIPMCLARSLSAARIENVAGCRDVIVTTRGLFPITSTVCGF